MSAPFPPAALRGPISFAAAALLCAAVGALAACGTTTSGPDVDHGDAAAAGRSGVGGSQALPEAGPGGAVAVVDALVGAGGGSAGGASGGGASGGGSGGAHAGPDASGGSVGGQAAPGDAGPGPVGDATPPPPEADADAPPPPDAGGVFPPARARVCCTQDAECGGDLHCSGGRCWDPIPTPPCDDGHPCAGGGLCENGLCQPACGCLEGSCAPGEVCITDDRACGICVPERLTCTAACERNLTTAVWAYLATDPLQDARRVELDGTLVADDRAAGGVGRRMELALDDGTRQALVYVLPQDLALPFALGERVHYTSSGLQQPGLEGLATLAGPEGVRMLVLHHRGAVANDALGFPFPFHIEDQGCGPTLIGNCLEAMPATLVLDIDGARSPALHTGDTMVLGEFTLAVARVYRDNNACDPAIHDLYANLVMVRFVP